MIKKNRFQININKYLDKKYCLFALPQTNDYQTISDLSIAPQPKIIKEKKWGNELALFTLNDVKDKIKISFQQKPKEIHKIIGSSFLLNSIQPKISPNSLINGKDKTIINITKKIIGTEKRIDIIAKKLYIFTLEYLTYGKPIEGLYPYSQALKERVTDCGGFSTFLLSLFQSVGIHGRLVVGFIVKESIYSKLFSNFEFCTLNFEFLIMHAWLEILLPDNSWFPMDPSVEWKRNKGLSKRKGGFGFIPADRLVVSYGEDFSINIKDKLYQIDIFQNPIFI